MCSHVLHKPKQTDCCHHIFCELCIASVQAQTKPCPVCDCTDFSTFYDKNLQQELSKLKVSCIYQKNGCTWTGELGKLESHLSWDEHTIGCEFVGIQCEFSSAGCKAQMPHKDMMAHIKEEQPHHIQLLDKKVKEQEREIGQLRLQLQNSNELLKQIQRQVRRVAPHLPLPDEKFHQLMEENRELKLFLSTQISELTVIQKPLQAASSTKPSQHISADFSFTMKNFDLHKSNNAVWYSEPFYTHPRGYKMCIRIDANGYEQVIGTHVSLYTCMMRGEFDDELSWPFRGEIAVELLNQDTDNPKEGNHYTIQYDNNVLEKYARRVTVGERSTGWGEPKFIPHFKLGPYLKDDCLKIQINIQLSC